MLAVLGGLLVAATASADLAEIKKAGVLRVVTVESNTPLPGKSPFLAIEKGQASGFDAEVLGGFARAHGLKLSVAVLPSWERLIPALLDGQADVAAGNVTASDARRKHVEFTIETLPTRVVLVSYPPVGQITSLEQIGNERVAVVRSTAPLEALLAAGVPRASLDDTLPVQGLLEALHSGRLRIATMELMAAVEAQRRDPKLQLGMFVGPSASLGYGVRRDCPRLLDALNGHVGGLKASPAWYRLLVANFGPAAPEVIARLRAEKR
jgi:ABC-type amino acid transport substrate-binding protein